MRNNRIQLRVTDDELRTLKNKAHKSNMSVAEYMRTSAIKKEVKAFIRQEEMEEIRKLTRLGNNLNQITKKLHTEGLAASAGEIDEIINKLKGIIHGSNR